METTKTNKNEFAIAMFDAYKKSKNPNVSPKFTKVELNKDGECVVTRDLYKMYRTAAIKVSKKHGIFNETKYHSVTDDDTLADWMSMFDGDLGLLQEVVPNITLSEVVDLFTWYSFCMTRAGSPANIEMLDITTHK